MSSDTYTKTTVHPYKASNNSSHKHFRETELKYPPFSLPARPFGWTMLRKGNDDNIRNLVRKFAIDYDPNREPNLSFPTNWVQDAEYATCPHCGKPMKYLAQIQWDTVFDCAEGTLYVEFCSDCQIVSMQHQQT